MRVFLAKGRILPEIEAKRPDAVRRTAFALDAVDQTGFRVVSPVVNGQFFSGLDVPRGDQRILMFRRSVLAVRLAAMIDERTFAGHAERLVVSRNAEEIVVQHEEIPKDKCLPVKERRVSRLSLPVEVIFPLGMFLDDLVDLPTREAGLRVLVHAVRLVAGEDHLAFLDWLVGNVSHHLHSVFTREIFDGEGLVVNHSSLEMVIRVPYIIKRERENSTR